MKELINKPKFTMSPKVSILLPNLNNRPYLDERIQTIFEQSFQDWELIIVDNYSDDGAWEFFKLHAQTETRMKLFQAPRKGMYANWNNCLKHATGKYIYFATSDDTMTPNFLEIMVGALDENPECDLAHCKLKIIDNNGAPHPTLNWDRFYSTVFFGELINKRHIRIAPYDGLLHCGLRTVYTSITQLLIRKKLFERIGGFLTDFGSAADFEWEMRASLISNTVHIPEYMATWRVHPEQGTDTDSLNSVKLLTELLEMIDHALDEMKNHNLNFFNRIKRNELKKLYIKEKLRAEIREKKTKFGRYQTAFKWMFTNPTLIKKLYSSWKNPARSFISSTEPLDFSKEILYKYGVENNIELIG